MFQLNSEFLGRLESHTFLEKGKMRKRAIAKR